MPFTVTVAHGRVLVVIDATVVTEVARRTEDYVGAEDAWDVADLVAKALTEYVKTEPGRTSWEAVRTSCNLETREES